MDIKPDKTKVYIYDDKYNTIIAEYNFYKSIRR